MKKIISLMLALTMVLALCACGTADKTQLEQEQRTQLAEEQKGQLAEVSQMLDTAYSDYKSASTIVLGNWDDSPIWFKYYFDKSAYDRHLGYDSAEYDEVVIPKCGEMWKLYEEADLLMQEALDTIKQISPAEDTADYYGAIKSYYTNIDAFRTLIQTWPEGYKKSTFSEAISSAKKDCDKAASDLAFY